MSGARAARRWSGLVIAALLAPAVGAAQELTVVRLEVRAAAVDSVRRLGIDVVETHPRGATVELVAVVGAADRARLAGRGWTVRDVTPGPDAAAQEARRLRLGARAYAVYRDYDDPARGINAWLRTFAAARGNVTLDSIGVTFEGRPLLVAKVGAAGDSPSRPNVLYVATYHAREWVAAETAVRLLAYLADSLPATPAGAALLAERDVWVMPVANPDGYQYTFTTTRLWRKNRRPNSDGTFGVDLNRNHDGFFGLDNVGSSPLPAAETYRGTAAESEAETRAIADFHRAHPPVASISYHSYTGALLYPWSHVSGLLSGDEPVFRALGGSALAPAVTDRLAESSLSRYYAAPGWQLYPTNGDYTGWAYRAFGTVGYTVELTAGCCVDGAYYGFVFPDDEPMLAQVFRDNLPFALHLLEAAGDLAQVAGGGAPRFESVWPRVRATVAAGSGAASILALADGAPRLVAVVRDSLDTGREFSRIRSDDPWLAGVRAVRVSAGSGSAVAEILARDGAETGTSWRGFTQLAGGIEGAAYWRGSNDTLVSPDIPVQDRSGLVLYYWTRHEGSLFVPQSTGRVDVSTDGGANWTTIQALLGEASAWYPVAVPLDAAVGAARLRVRFVATDFSWSVDAIAVAASESSLFSMARAAPSADIMVNRNPVSGGTVTLRWASTGTGTARVDVYSLLGTPVRSSGSLPGDPGRWVWDVSTDGGSRVVAGAYLIVVTRGDGSRLRRRLIVAR